MIMNNTGGGYMQGQVIPISPDHIVGETARLKVEGFRFVTISCVETDHTRFDLLYHFDNNFQLTHLRLTLCKETAVPSIAPCIWKKKSEKHLFADMWW